MRDLNLFLNLELMRDLNLFLNLNHFLNLKLKLKLGIHGAVGLLVKIHILSCFRPFTHIPQG